MVLVRRTGERVLTGIALLAVVLVAPLAGASPALAASAPVAVATWSMVPQSKDANGDGFIDGDGGVPERGALTLQPSTTFVGKGNGIAQPNERLIDGAVSWYLDPRGYPVRLDACRSTGDRYTWTIAGALTQQTTTQQTATKQTTTPRALRPKTCRTTLWLPEGPHTFTLTVTSGKRTATRTVQADVRNILVVALGDSYASGEGNPRNVQAWMKDETGRAFRPYWDDDACHRSARGAPAHAALLLEEESPHTSVTLVDVSCSGATLDAGILGAQRGAGQTRSQIAQARSIVGNRAVDIVTVSVGGNDIGFTTVLTGCMTNSDCAIRPTSQTPLAGFPTMHDGVQARIAALPAAFARLAGCLGGTSCASGTPLRLSPDARILPTMYPDITRARDGSPCTYLTLRAENSRWARDTILVPGPAAAFDYRATSGAVTPLPITSSLNQQIAATDRLGWAPVVGTWSTSGDSASGHGFCAGKTAWTFGLTALSGFASASFHPNPTGQSVLASAIFDRMAS